MAQQSGGGGGPAAGPNAYWKPAAVIDPKAEANAELAARRKFAADPRARARAAAALAKKRKLQADAEAKAKAAAAAQKKALAHQAYLDLGKRMGAFMKSLAPPKATGPMAGPSAQAAGDHTVLTKKQMEKRAALNAKEQRAAEIAAQLGTARTMTSTEALNLEGLRRRDKAGYDKAKQDYADRIVVAESRTKKGTDIGVAPQLEKILDARMKRQAASGGKDVDIKFIDSVRNALSEHALAVRDALIAASNKLSKMFVLDKHGRVVSVKATKAQYAAALKSYNALKKEHNRLFLDDMKDPKHTKGSFFAAMNAADQIAKSQRQYIRDVAKAVFFKGADEPRTEFMAQKNWDRAQWDYIVDLSEADIDPTQTSIIYVKDKKTGKMTGRHRTPREEFEFRQGLYKAEMERRTKDMASRQALIAEQRTQNMTEGRTEFVDARNQRIAQSLADAQTRLGHRNDTGWIQGKGNVERTVNEAMRKWTEDNKRLFYGSSGGMGPKGRADFAKAHKEAEDQMYQILGGTKEGAIDRLANSPISALTTPLLAVAGGAGSVITGGFRAGLYMTTGTSTLNLPVNLGDLPPAVADRIKKQVEAEVQKLPLDKRPSGRVGLTTQAMRAWMRGEGHQWEQDFEKARKTKSDTELAKFAGTFYQGDANLWERLNALSEFGANPTTNAALNLAMGIGLDPTIALPLKFTTWGARWAHAVEATAGMNKAERAANFMIQFQKVDEPTLRWSKFVKPYMDDIAKGADQKILLEGVLQRLAGIKEGPDRNKAAEEFLRSIGVDTKTTSGKMMLNSTQEAIVSKMKEMGIDYEDVLHKATQFENSERVRIATEKAVKSEAARLVDEREAAKEAAAFAQGTEKRIRIGQEEYKAAVASAEQEVRDALKEQAENALKREAEAPLRGTVHQAPGESAEFIRREVPHLPLAETPLRNALRDVQEAAIRVRSAQYSSGAVHVADASGASATILHAIEGGIDTMYHSSGVEYAPGEFMDTFFASPEYKHIEDVLRPWTSEMTEAQAAAKLKHKPEDILKAKADLREAGRKSIAAERQRAEGLSRGHLRPLEDGRIPYADGDVDGKKYAVAGGQTSGRQHIPTPIEVAQRGGAVTPMDEVRLMEVRTAFEAVKKRLVSAKKRYTKLVDAENEVARAEELWNSAVNEEERSYALQVRTNARIKMKKAAKGALTEEEYQEELQRIRLIGVDLRADSYSAWVTAGDGVLFSQPVSELDHIIYGGGLKGFLSIGNVMVDDFLSTGTINGYYETLSLLPEMMKAPGMQTKFMEHILDPGWREMVGAERFAGYVRSTMFMGAENGPTPVEFRAAAAHLFALFHMTKLDAEDALWEVGEAKKLLQQRKITPEEFRSRVGHINQRSNNAMDRLHDYSIVMRLLGEEEPENIYAKMWAVMQSRGGGEGVWWAEDIAETEAAFIDTALRYNRNLHPNLALATIPYGPIARQMPVGHGYTFHMRNLATTRLALLPGSPARWTDDVAIDEMGVMANAAVPVYERIQQSSRIAHYIASRYGSSMRRKRFQIVLQDFSLEATGRFRSISNAADYEYQNFRSTYIKHMMETDPSAIDPEVVGKYFDSLFTRKIRPGLQRRYFDDDVRKIYEDLYWSNKVTHGNAALHTSKFFERMGDPRMQRGDTWLKYANSYFDHMAAAGEEEYARTILKEMFEQRASKEARDAWEAIKGVDASAPIETNVWRGGVREFFLRTGVMKPMEEIVAEGERRVEYERQFAQLEADAAEMRNELQIVDDVAREKKRAFDAKAESAAMYDNATMENLSAQAIRAKNTAVEAEADIAKLTAGKTALDVATDALDAADEAWDAAVATFRKNKKAPGAEAALEKAAKVRDLAERKAQRIARRGIREEKATAAVAQAKKTLAGLPADAAPERVRVAERGVEVAQERLDKMGVGTHAESPRRVVTTGIQRPSEVRMKAYHIKVAQIQKWSGKSGLAGFDKVAKTLPLNVRRLFRDGKSAEAVQEYLRTLPPDVQAWMNAELKAKSSQRQMTKLLNSIVHRSAEAGSMSTQVGEEMAELVAHIKSMPGGNALLQQYAGIYYSDLLRSRLIDYLKHEEWFKWEGREARIESDVTDITHRLTEAQNDISKVREKMRTANAPTNKERAAMQGELAAAQTRHANLEAERAKLLKSREGGQSRLDEIEKQLAADEKPTPISDKRRAELEAQERTLEERLKPREEKPTGRKVAQADTPEAKVLVKKVEDARAELNMARGHLQDKSLSPRARAALEKTEARLRKEVGLATKALKEEREKVPQQAASGVFAAAEAARLKAVAAEVMPRLREVRAELAGRHGKLGEARREALQKEAAAIKEDMAGGGPGKLDRQASGEGRVVPPTEEEITARTSAPYGPHPDELNSPRVAAAQEALRILQQMDESKWLAAEELRARQMLKTVTGVEKGKWVNRLRDIRKAQLVIEVAESGGKKKMITTQARSSFAKSVQRTLGERAKGAVAPGMITSYVGDAAGLEVEEGRALRVLLLNSETVDPSVTLIGEQKVTPSQVRRVAAVTRTYKRSSKRIEARFGQPLKTEMLTAYGFPSDMLSDLNAIELVTNLDEFGRALRDGRFMDFTTQFTSQMDREIRAIAGKDYGLEQYLNDRLLMRGDHFDARKFEALEQEVSDAIARERQGFKRGTLTDLISPRSEGPVNVRFEAIETDVRAVIAKTKVLSAHGVDVHAYNEARQVLRKPLLRKRYGQHLVTGATQAANDAMAALGKKAGSKDYDRLWREAYDKDFEVRRAAMADQEAGKLLNQLAYEMHGHTHMEVIAEFERRYGMDFDVRPMEKVKISPFQERTLRAAIGTHLGVDDIDDISKMTDALSAHGQVPPMHSRDAMVEWLTKYGFWNRRTGDQIAAAGSKSWDIRTEAKYYRDRWGVTPPWADDTLFEKGGELHELLHDEAERGAQWRAWGIFGRNMKARFETAAMSRAERARFMVEGSEALGVKPKRDLPMERQYVIDRYGDIVTDSAGNLTAFPELMNRSELRNYILERNRAGLGTADGIFDNVVEMEVYHQILDFHVGRLFDDSMMAGKTVTFDDVYEMSANIVHDMMLNPVWAKRDRDALGKLIRGQATLRRAFIFTNPAFAGTNIVDSAIKAGWFRFSERSFFRGNPSAKARSLTDRKMWGFEPHGQLTRDIPVAGRDRIRRAREAGRRVSYNWETGEVIEETASQKKFNDGLQVIIGATEFPAEAASGSENFFKIRLAQGMYDEAYARALRDLGGDEELADASARLFIRDEVNRLWPTVGDGPIEQLFNQLFPFMSYQFKNRVLWLGELAAHPYFFNYFNKIGNYIEQSNRERWAREGTSAEHTDAEARQIELPWSPGSFVDLGGLSDMQAGLKPLYDIANGKATVQSLSSQFVRLVSANEVNLFYATLNTFHVGWRKEWVKEMKDGFPTGEWRQIEVPWQAPWSHDPATVQGSFWFLEDAGYWNDALTGQFTIQKATKAAWKTMFFGNFSQHDQGRGLQDYYFTLRDANPAAADEWLKTSDGLKLKMWWTEKAKDSHPKSYEWNPSAVNNILFPRKEDRSPWLHAQDKAFQDKVKAGLDEKRQINKKWDAILWEMTPGTQEFTDAKLERRTEIFNFYLSHPEMLDYEAGAMTPEKWAAQLDSWETDDRVDEFFALAPPNRDKYADTAAGEEKYQKARRVWLKQRTDFLKAFPTVGERLASTRTSVEAVWRDTEQHWFDVLDKIGTRSIAIQAAKESKNYSLVDQLYAANDLDYAQLDEETAVNYFNPETDFIPLGYDANGKEKQGPRLMRLDPFGHQLLQRTKVLPDFTSWRYDRADAAGKAKMEKDMTYANGIKEVIAKAKKAKNFGAEFVRLMKADPALMREYFARNPGKQHEWASNDQYISIISKFGRLMKAGKFDEGHAYFDRLPDWVKARYYSNHPEKRAQRGRTVENLQYLNYMKRWTDHYKKRDYAGGAAFFQSMPKWVKDRYYSKHPDGFGKGGTGGSSPYSRAMKGWVDLLQSGQKDAAKAYFDTLPKAFKDRYYAGHPDAKLRDNVQRVGQLGTYFAADDANRAQYLKDNPDFAKWLASQGTSEQTRRMEIMEAYRALPKSEAWLRRVYREKYPEIFSKEAAGTASLKKVYSELGTNPELNPGFEKWLAAIWASYAENIKHTAARPKPIESIHPRQHGSDRATPHGGKSAAWVRLHSLS